ncbi:MAG: hypothetical protein AABY53_07750, partial [Bdellovibrionota bacterium]
MTNLTNETAWVKVSEFVKDKFGKNLKYRSIKLISDNAVAVNRDSFYSVGEDLIIPLKLKNYDLGDVIVSRGSFLDDKQKTEVMDLVKLLVEPKVYSLQLKQTEENLQNSKANTLSIVNSNSVRSINRFEKFNKLTISQIIFLKSHTELTCNKVALKIHEMSERNLFVHLKDIISTLSSKEDFKTLTDATIYINDIESLSKTTLNLLQDYLELNYASGPLILIGSSLSLEALQQRDWPTDLKKDLMGFYDKLFPDNHITA